MGHALYRKYRSKTLDDVVGQAHITDTLKHAVASGHISHAYLFTGPRGVGKTSIARILAHQINDLPYGDEATHLDIIEIDAASNRRIDEIRELRDKVNIAPTSAKYKVYIIDEVHMLTREAFNALLKTLEEPPAHAVFILATTEIQKLPDTIVSRTQRFAFKPVPLTAVVEHLRTIAEHEQIEIDDAALALIAEHGGGSFRDSISLLDQVGGAGTKITADFVQRLLGIPPDEALRSLQDELLRHDAAAVVCRLTGLRDQGYQSAEIARRLGRQFRQTIIAHGAHSPADFSFLSSLLGVPAAADPDVLLEIVTLDYALAGQPLAAAPSSPAPPTITNDTPPTAASHAAAEPPAPPAPVTTPPPSVAPASKPAPAAASTAKKTVSAAAAVTPPPAAATPEAPTESWGATAWPAILARLKQTHNTLYTTARMAEPNFNGNNLELKFKFAFHQKRFSDVKNQEVIANAILEVTGQRVQISCIADAKAAPPASVPLPAAAAPVAGAEPSLAAISNIFGGGTVVG